PPPPASRQSRQPTKPEIGGSILDADDAPQGVNFARRNTPVFDDRILGATTGRCRTPSVAHKGRQCSPCLFRRARPTAAPGRVRGSGTAASVGLSTARLAAMPG